MIQTLWYVFLAAQRDYRGWIYIDRLAVRPIDRHPIDRIGARRKQAGQRYDRPHYAGGIGTGDPTGVIVPATA